MKIPRVRSFGWMLGLVAGLAAIGAGAEGLEDDEVVVFFPALGWRSGTDWEVEMRAWIGEPERRRLATWVATRALDLKLEDLTQAERSLAEQRLQPFLVDNEGGRRVTVQAGRRRIKLPESRANGHSTGRFRMTGREWRRWRETGVLSNDSFRVLIPDGRGHRRPISVNLFLVPPEGLSVISDIDDTIKVSGVTDRDELLRNTFCRPMRAVDGMAARYQEFAKRGAVFHYVSASPWQLYEPLAAFVASNGFPAGTFHLRPFRIQDGSFLALFASPERYKPAVIEELLGRFPGRRFVLIGDSGEKDPEIYGDLARRHPAQVVRVLIRIVPGAPDNPERWRQAFAGLPRESWQVFTDPSAMPADGIAVSRDRPNPRSAIGPPPGATRRP